MYYSLVFFRKSGTTISFSLILDTGGCVGLSPIVCAGASCTGAAGAAGAAEGGVCGRTLGTTGEVGGKVLLMPA